MPERPRVLLSDANVLIDYLSSDVSILARVCEHVAPLHVLREVLEEVEGLTLTRCRELGMTVVELEPEALLEVPGLPRRLSRRDRLSLLTCRDRDWICVTNDRPLRRVCEEHGVRVQWGLELMIELVDVRALSAPRALTIARAIHESNPHHITEAILERFRRRVSR